MIRTTLIVLVLALAALPACTARGPSLAFPQSPLERTEHLIAFDADHDGIAEFSVRTGPDGRFDVLGYDDNRDGSDDRVYRLSDYANEDVPHLIILLDSIPYQELADRYEQARWTWFDPPRKVIPPFPTMSGVIFSRILHAPPLGGMINQYFDRERGTITNRISQRAGGAENPWEQRLHYRLRYWENGLSFLEPRSWFRVELERARQAFERSPDRVSIVYLASTAGMLSKHGAQGLQEVLDGLEQLCLSILHSRRGAVKITVMADHGHRLQRGRRIDLPSLLRHAGFYPSTTLASDNAAVVELDGLVNYAGVHTRQPAQVAGALVSNPEVELAMYLEQDHVIVQSRAGRARVDLLDARLKYTPIDADVLGYQPVIDTLRAAGKLDADGFASDRDWFDATVDHHWPDAPARLWEAFHGLAVNTPDVMITTAPGCYAGLASMEWFITMASTHGGFDQKDSATFVMTMTGRATRPMRSAEVLPIVEPTFSPDRKP
ncbi:hypothetical protein PHYC_02270 [Phycisphaerales bacterium]|nr:hypothetical protein PHYC_02270 [Phycisphaerales bacterium]